MINKNNRSPGVEADYQTRLNPALMTRLLHNAVPVLKHVDWKIESVGYGSTETVLPLNRETTNQHGTHQAALISLSADYTGGMALATLLTGVPVSGVHKCAPDNAVSLWLASMNVKYHHPSTDHLHGSCHIDPEKAERIRKRYFQGKTVLVSLPIDFHSNDRLVATGELKYFAQPTIQLLTRKDKPTALFSQKIKASARMIAGVRASQASSTFVRVDCPHAEVAAGPHGKLLAQRLRSALPQLTDMVLARTQHIDQTIAQMKNLKQVVLLGAGLDMRPFRIGESRPEISFFEIDLPEMLEERESVVSKVHSEHSLAGSKRYSLSADFRKDDIASLVQSESPFDPRLPTLIVYEGCSMYFDETQNERLLKNVWQLAQHPDTKIWCDLVKTSVVDGRTNQPEVLAFLKQMEDLGEKFVFGCDSPNSFLSGIGCTSSTSLTCQHYLRTNLPVFDVYQFCVGASA